MTVCANLKRTNNQKSRREEERENMEILIISGLSGGGKSRTASFLEDMGFYIVDNMPAGMILKFAEF